jgi:DnaJ-class molecular chaperone
MKGENNQKYYSSYKYRSYDNYNTKQEKKPEKSKREKAKQIFEIKGDFNASTLKKRYRELMKKYHPDINPNGLEKSQQINLAYTILLSEVN